LQRATPIYCPPHCLRAACRASKLRPISTKPEHPNQKTDGLRRCAKCSYLRSTAIWQSAIWRATCSYIKTGSQGFHTSSIGEVRQYEARHPVSTKARLTLVAQFAF